MIRDLDADLIGAPGGRAHLSTPALVIDRDALARNVATMAAHAKAKGLALRPHAKTHKSAHVARLQLAAGAVGICVAKLGEAEALADEGIDGLLITSPIVAPRALARLSALNARLADLIVVVGDPAMVEPLGDAARASGKPLKLLVDLDVGLHRTGVRPGDDAVALAQAVAAEDGLQFEGLQAYAGQVQHIHDAAERRAKSHAALDLMAATRDALIAKDLAPSILSGGGTGTFDVDGEAGVLTELQCGSYVFMDREYDDVWAKGGGRAPFEPSLFVRTTVIAAALPQLATTDAGLKAFACDAGPPRIARGAGPTASYFFFGDEQGGVLCERAEDRPKLGDALECVVPHCDPTVNLYDRYHVVSGDALVEIWPVHARGRGR